MGEVGVKGVVGCRVGREWGAGGVRGLMCCGAKAAALRWEDGAVIRPSRWLELSRTA